eukprot:gene4443-14593_t
MGSSDERALPARELLFWRFPPVTIQSFLEPIPMNKSDILSAQLVPEIQSSPRSGSRSGFFSGDASRSLPKSESKPCSKKHLLESHDTVPPVKDFHMTDSMQEYVMEAYSALVTDSTEPVPRAVVEVMHSLRPWAISMFSVGSVIWCLIAVSLGILTQLNATDAVTEELTCKSSGYCSLGNTKFFTGEINSSSGLKSALDAVSYKKEIVIVTINGEYHVEMLLQLRQDFEDLGMSHFLVLSITDDYCKSVQSIQADASCEWDSPGGKAPPKQR